MKKNILILLSTLLLIPFLLELLLRVLGFLPAHSGELKYIPVIEPDSFFVQDPVLGWRLGTGEFRFYQNDSLYFRCNVKGDGNRAITTTADSIHPDSIHSPLKKIALYGCSYTFGQSVQDTSHYPYYLQKLLPDYSVYNKGVPGYSPVQMYLSLVKDVKNHNKPDVAVINYGSFHEERTVLSRGWINGMQWAFSRGNADRKFEIHYPFARLVNEDSISIDYLKWKDWPRDFPLRDKSVLVNLVNTAYNNYNYKRNIKNYDRINLLSLYKIQNYCNQNGIRLLYFGLNQDSKAVLDSLFHRGAVVKISTVEIHQEGMNCSPFDPHHPSPRAHRIYAREVLEGLRSHHLLND